MEAWLAELEMGHHNIMEYPQSEQHHQNRERMETTSFNEQLAAALGDDFPYPLSSESNTSSSPQLDFDYTDFIEPFSPPLALASSNQVQSGAPYMGGGGQVLEDQPPTQIMKNHDNQKSKGKEKDDDDDDGNKKGETGNKKRKREPSQVLDHIMAERKRRELLSQRFIALSAIVPGLKKTDKTTVLGEAIKYMKQLQEKVKVFEEVEAKRTVESVVVVNKSHLVVDDEAVDDNGSSCTIDGKLSSNKSNDLLPDIEVKVSDKTLLFKVYCEKQKGCLGRLFGELEKHDDISIVSSSIIPFGTMGSDITIVLQKEKGFDNKNVKDLVRPLRSALMLHSPRTKSK